MNKIIHGNSLIELKSLPENSIDSIVTDPPYELGFMGKSWDNTGIANNPLMWAECLRVLKPGGYLLSFGGTRTYHRMAVAIEDAGFEVRDMIEWVYGSGFPKSLSVGKAINKLETKEWSKIGKALDNIDQESIMEVWKRNSNNVRVVETQSLKNQIIAGQDMPNESFVPVNVAENINQENLNLLVSFAEQNLNEVQATNTKIHTALQNVEAEIKQSLNLAKSVEQLLQDHNPKSWNIFTAECDVKEWLKENTMVSHKVDEALKTLRGNQKYSNEEIISVLCAVIPNILKHTILNQSRTFQNLDTNQKMECASVINVIITEYTAENLISNTVSILKSKAVDNLQGNERETYLAPIAYPDSDCWGKPNSNSKGNDIGFETQGTGTRKDMDGKGNQIKTKGTSEWEGWGTALKPAHEPICMARKPLAEKTVAENVLKYGTGGINIDESRVEITNGEKPNGSGNKSNGSTGIDFHGGNKETGNETSPLGRFPANLIHDNSEEVRECFPETKTGRAIRSNSGGKTFGGENTKPIMEDLGYEDGGGNASRFFKSIIYQAKASKSERNKGCEELEEKEEVYPGINTFDENGNRLRADGSVIPPLKSKNNHPTVKPIALMEYLIKMVTPKGGTVLDPFAGSGSTLVAAKQNGYQYIGIEMTEEYIPIIKARLK